EGEMLATDRPADEAARLEVGAGARVEVTGDGLGFDAEPRRVHHAGARAADQRRTRGAHVVLAEKSLDAQAVIHRAGDEEVGREQHVLAGPVLAAPRRSFS